MTEFLIEKATKKANSLTGLTTKQRKSYLELCLLVYERFYDEEECKGKDIDDFIKDPDMAREVFELEYLEYHNDQEEMLNEMHRSMGVKEGGKE